MRAGTLIATASLAGSFGLLAASSLAGRVPSLRPDRALMLSALAAFVAPLWILGLLSSPPMATTRRLLGEPSAATLKASVWAASLVTLAMTAVPAGTLLGALLHPEASADLLRGAALLGCAAVGSGLLSLYTLAIALEHISQGTAETWRAMSGGGAFGPPETTPLLYAPAIAFALSMIPIALLSAVWGTRADLLRPEVALGTMGGVFLLGALLARRKLRKLRARARRAWLIVEQAHATPFASDENIPETPSWLGGDKNKETTSPEAAALKLIARSWVRRYPSSAPATVALALIAALSLSRHEPWWLVAGICAAIVLYSGTRALDLARVDPGVEGAARWLGLGAEELRRANLSLGLRLLLPSLSLIAVGWSTKSWLATLGGAAVGAALALASLSAQRHRGALVWIGRAALAAALVSSAASGGAATPLPHAPQTTPSQPSRTPKRTQTKTEPAQPAPNPLRDARPSATRTEDNP